MFFNIFGSFSYICCFHISAAFINSLFEFNISFVQELLHYTQLLETDNFFDLFSLFKVSYIDYHSYHDWQ